jgi:two-component system chemotaxis sensor kinase CheA
VISSAAAADLTAEEALQLVFASGLSTSGQVSDISGRGVGMDVVKTNVGRLRGSVRLHTKVGVGTTVTMRLPLTLAISQALLVTAGPTTAAIPLVYVTETTRVPRADVESVRHRLVTSFRGRVLPLVSLHDLLGQSGAAFAEGADAVRVVVVRSADQELGLIVDLLLGDEEIVLKPLGSALGDVPGVSGATILGDGTVALVLDVASLLERGDVRAALREAT